MIYRTLFTLAAATMIIGTAAAKGKEMIALAGSYVDNVAIIEKASGKEVFSYKLPQGSECNTLFVLKNGNVVISYKKGARMVSPAGAVIWDFAVPTTQELQTVRLLPGNKVLLGVCASPMRLIELDMKGNLLSEVNYDLKIENPHSQFRQICKTKSGNYLVPVISQAKVIEIDRKGAKVEQWSVPPTPFSVKELSNGNLLVSTLGELIEVERAGGAVVRTVAKGAMAVGDTLRFSTEAARLKNGNTMLSNWQGYSKSNDSQLVELDAQGKVVYTFRDTAIMKNVSGFYLFEK